VLSSLHIRNFALIEDLSVEFGRGLNILTGETGAGKSIIFQGLHLLLGGRASSDFIRKGARDAEVSGLFSLKEEAHALQRAAALGLSTEGADLLLRRVVSSEGKNRCYVNGAPATVGMLEKIGEFLVDIHGQHQHQRLLHPENHLEVLDAFAGLEGKRGALAEGVRKVRSLEARKRELEQAEAHQQSRIELFEFQVREIEGARVVAGEEETLESEIRLLSHAEERRRLAQEVFEALYGSEGSVTERLASLAGLLARLGEIDPEQAGAAQEGKEALVQVEELARGLRDYAERVEANSERLQQAEERLHLLRMLKKKYGGSLDSVLAFQQEAQQELESMSRREEALDETTRALDTLRSKVAKEALLLSKVRREGALHLSKSIEREIQTLGMKRVSFEVPLWEEEDPESFVERDGKRLRLSKEGIDQVEFQLEPNPGEGLRPLSRIASGGELSRVMLAVKAVLADRDQVSTLVFDEVDAGIGGAVAEVVGQKLKGTSRGRQVFCITHLPQIAALADHHFLISKVPSKGRTKTEVRPLTLGDRVEEIARMSGGKTVTETTRRHAREILGIS